MSVGCEGCACSFHVALWVSVCVGVGVCCDVVRLVCVWYDVVSYKCVPHQATQDCRLCIDCCSIVNGTNKNSVGETAAELQPDPRVQNWTQSCSSGPFPCMPCTPEVRVGFMRGV